MVRAPFVAVLLALAAFIAPAQAQKVVRVWHTETGEKSVAALAAIARRFEARHPGVRIEPTALGWTELEGRIMAAVAAGTPPELSHGQPITCAALQAKGLLLPLNAVVESIGEADLWDQVKRVCREGKDYYGVVHAAATSLLVYRRDLAQKRGLKAPATWAALLANARALSAPPAIYGVTIPGDNLFINILLGELIKANGGVLFGADHRPRLTDKPMIETLAFLRELARYAPPGWEGHSYRETFTNLYEQKAAMMVFALGRGTSMIEQFAPKEMANAGTFDVWVKPHGPSGKEPAAQVDEEPWMLFKGARHTAEAVEFLKFFYQKENYLEYLRSEPIHLLPITKSMLKDRDYQATPMIGRWQSWITVQQQYLERDQGKPALVVEWDDLAQRPYLLDVLNSGILRDMVMQAAVERVAPEKAAALAQRRVEDLLRMRGHLK